MQKTAQGYVSEQNLDALLAQTLPKTDQLPDYTLLNMPRRIDSADIVPGDWTDIGRMIVQHYSEFDGFVVLHGTDTMAYTASALSFMLQGLDKPVILTGSQIPLRQMRNDAQNNLITALMLAAHHPISEVTLYFNGRLLRGNRASKAKADDFDAFDSPNFPYLGTVGIKIEIEQNLVRPAGSLNFHCPNLQAGTVIILRLFPGIDSTWLERCLQEPVQGIVLQAYGVGNAPVGSTGFLDVLARAHERGIVMVNVSQCAEGRVDLSAYATGSALHQCGVIGALDMTTEAAFCKLYHLLGSDLSTTAIQQQFAQNLCGECTPDHSTTMDF